MVTSVFAGTVALAGTAASQQATVADAPPGTIFNQVLRGGDPGNAVAVGLIKRGAAGNQLYNPSSDRLTLNAGDVVVARDGTEYLVPTQQRLTGSTGAVGPGTTVFQGEEDTVFVGFDGDTLIGVENGGAEGETLDLNQTVPGDQDTGIYSDDGTRQGNTIIVQEPRISRLEIINQNGQRIDAGGSIEEDEFVIVRFDVNFIAAERAEVFLVDPRSGSVITDGLLTRDEAIDQFPGSADVIRDIVPEGKNVDAPAVGDRSLISDANRPSDTFYLIQDLQEVEKAGDYEYLVLAEDDEPYGDLYVNGVSRTIEFSVTSSDEPVLNFADDRTLVQGEFAEYEIDRSTAGDVHVVSIAVEDLRTRPSGDVSVSEVTRVFREFNDGGFTSGVLVRVDGELVAVLEDGRVFSDGQESDAFPDLADGDVPARDIQQIFTLVEIDTEGLGINQLDTGRLDDTSIDINLFDGFASGDDAVADYENNDARDEVDEVTFRVTEGEEDLAILEPGAAYVAGDDVDVEGTANPAIDAVAVYARDDEDWEVIGGLERVSVDADGTWDERDVTLSEDSRILRVPGTYRIGVIDVEDADFDGDGVADDTLTTSRFSSGTSIQRGLRVTDQALDGEMQTYNGQVAVEDGTINVTGVAPGAEQVVIVFVGDRGSVVVNRDTVDDQDVFDNEDTLLSDEDGLLEEGNVRGFIISPARDNTFGAEDERTVAEFVSFVNGLEERGLTQSQAISLIREASVDDPGSDDLMVETEFEFTDADTTIRDVVPSEMSDASGVQDIALGETMLVRGVTNLRPDDNTIVLEFIRGPSADSIDVGIADDWMTDGLWSTEIAIPSDVETGTYTLRADDGETITTVMVEIVEEREEPTTAEPTTATPEPTTTTTPEPTPTATPEPTPEPTTTETTSPGFGLVVAAGAALLVAAALLAWRRRTM